MIDEKNSKSTFMKIYQDTNVFDKALERINWLFDEFDTVATNISGGKDSTVVLELLIKVAKERKKTSSQSFIFRPRSRMD